MGAMKLIDDFKSYRAQRHEIRQALSEDNPDFW